MTKFVLIAALGAIARVSAAGPAAVNLGKAGSNVSAEEAEECSHMQRAHAKSVGEAVKDDAYHFELDIQAGPGVTITGKAFIPDSDNSPNGCGAGYAKCTCAYTDEGFKMRGWGTQGTATGLEF
ncbi:unnamed protein product [Polarella glacialis]|uniref:Uncharacterized protein n=1 Tax=Polarella glacialis TaxID=89957 RepID=A0A813HU87_POLGL|nr:unnamed protein product [Polarella glacialis]